MKLNIDKQHELIKDALEHQILMFTDACSKKELINNAVISLIEDEVYGKLVDENEVRRYITLIVSNITNIGNTDIQACEVCSMCESVLLESDECYEKYNGEPLCAKCSVLCECCDRYYIENKGIRSINSSFTCSPCSVSI